MTNIASTGCTICRSTLVTNENVHDTVYHSEPFPINKIDSQCRHIDHMEESTDFPLIYTSTWHNGSIVSARSNLQQFILGIITLRRK